MTSFKLFATLVLTATAASALTAETHCPGNVESLPYRSLNRHQIPSLEPIVTMASDSGSRSTS